MDTLKQLEDAQREDALWRMEREAKQQRRRHICAGAGIASLSAASFTLFPYIMTLTGTVLDVFLMLYHLILFMCAVNAILKWSEKP